MRFVDQLSLAHNHHYQNPSLLWNYWCAPILTLIGHLLQAITNARGVFVENNMFRVLCSLHVVPPLCIQNHVKLLCMSYIYGTSLFASNTCLLYDHLFLFHRKLLRIGSIQSINTNQIQKQSFIIFLCTQSDPCRDHAMHTVKARVAKCHRYMADISV